MMSSDETLSSLLDKISTARHREISRISYIDSEKDEVSCDSECEFKELMKVVIENDLKGKYTVLNVEVERRVPKLSRRKLKKMKKSFILENLKMKSHTPSAALDGIGPIANSSDNVVNNGQASKDLSSEEPPVWFLNYMKEFKENLKADIIHSVETLIKQLLENGSTLNTQIAPNTMKENVDLNILPEVLHFNKQIESEHNYASFDSLKEVLGEMSRSAVERKILEIRGEEDLSCLFEAQKMTEAKAENCDPHSNCSIYGDDDFSVLSGVISVTDSESENELCSEDFMVVPLPPCFDGLKIKRATLGELHRKGSKVDSTKRPTESSMEKLQNSVLLEKEMVKKKDLATGKHTSEVQQDGPTIVDDLNNSNNEVRANIGPSYENKKNQIEEKPIKRVVPGTSSTEKQADCVMQGGDEATTLGDYFRKPGIVHTSATISGEPVQPFRQLPNGRLEKPAPPQMWRSKATEEACGGNILLQGWTPSPFKSGYHAYSPHDYPHPYQWDGPYNYGVEELAMPHMNVSDLSWNAHHVPKPTDETLASKAQLFINTDPQHFPWSVKLPPPPQPYFPLYTGSHHIPLPAQPYFPRPTQRVEESSSSHRIPEAQSQCGTFPPTRQEFPENITGRHIIDQDAFKHSQHQMEPVTILPEKLMQIASSAVTTACNIVGSLGKPGSDILTPEPATYVTDLMGFDPLSSHSKQPNTTSSLNSSKHHYITASNPQQLQDETTEIPEIIPNPYYDTMLHNPRPFWG